MKIPSRRSAWNWTLYALGAAMLLLAFESAPLPGWIIPSTNVPITQYLVPSGSSYFALNVTNLVTFPPQGAKNLSLYEGLPFSDCLHPPPKIKVECYYFTGFVELWGKGGLSVDNPINLNVTINVPPSFTSQVANISAITFIPEAVLNPSFSINSTFGIPQNVHIHLHKQSHSYVNGWTTWTGGSRVMYSLSGQFGGEFLTTVANSPYPPINGTVPAFIQVGSSDVTAQSYTGEITTSVAFIAVALTLFTLRSKGPETIVVPSPTSQSPPAAKPAVPNRQKFRHKT